MSLAKFDGTGNLIVNDERWKSIADDGDKWLSRYQKIATLLKSGESVVEFGCSGEAIRKVLPEGCRYQPVDIVKRSPECLVVNLMTASPAKIPGPFDVAIFAGVLEYLPNPFHIISETLKTSGRVIFTYATLDRFPDMKQRVEEYGWFSHMTLEAIVGANENDGFVVQQVGRWFKQHIFVATPRFPSGLRL